MNTTLTDLHIWFKDAPEGATHMVVWTDTFDHSDYPEYVTYKDSELLRADLAKRDGMSMQRLTEVYNLGLDFGSQASDFRAMNY